MKLREVTRKSYSSRATLWLLFSFFLLSVTFPAVSQTETLIAEAEAEDGIMAGVVKATANTGYSGSGYVTGFDNDGDQLTVSINISEPGMYKLKIRYNGLSGDKIQDVVVNDGYASPVTFPSTSGYEIADAGSYELTEGENTFTVRKSWGWTDIDKFMLFASVPNVYDIDSVPVDPDAMPEVRNLYNMLRLQFGSRILSGQTEDYYNQVRNLTGKSPLIKVGDMQSYTEGYPYRWESGGHTFGWTDYGTADSLINWYNRTGGKGIVSFQWHWHSPSGGKVSTNTFYTSLTDFDITRAVTPGTQEYTDIIRDIDSVAGQLKKFRDEGIPVLWRPLHEAGGGWFWWGAKGPEACLALYDIMYDRMTNYHQLNNLLWIWSTPEDEWYPGNDKVDIIGHDSYPGSYNYGTQKNAFDRLYRITGGKKMIAMTENGPIPDPEECLRLDAPWLYFMSWSDLVSEQNSEQHIREVYDNPLVLNLESDNFKTSRGWRSSLYPENWSPGYKDDRGRFLHDFSYAGYHSAEKEIPFKSENLVDVTKAPYMADNTGTEDVTAVIQQAIDDVAASGGGVVYLPAGLYRIKPASSEDYALRISDGNIILRGAGPDSTFLFNDETFMRFKDIIRVRGQYASWFVQNGNVSKIRQSLPEPTRVIPVESVEGFSTGDEIILRSDVTPEFVAEHDMSGYWTEGAIKGVAFKRRIDSIDSKNNVLVIDAPTRYFLKTRDFARVYHAGVHLEEIGIEDLSIGNRENPKAGWDEESYTSAGTGAYDVHFSQVIRFNYSQNCWVRNVHSYRPGVNTGDFHILSNGILLDQCRNITIDSCYFQKPQYEGGGGNGYMYTLQSNDCLIRNSIANDSRHNYDFKYPFSNGNVIHNCRMENSKYSSDFHMYLSMANLFDACTVNGDYLESVFRPWGGDAIHGYSSTQSVFYNTFGESYHVNRDYLIESRQFGMGYIIGTSGPADGVKTGPVIGSVNGYAYDTSPLDFTEGIGEGEDLRPVSLYLDQLENRKLRGSGLTFHDVDFIVREPESNMVLPGCSVKVYSDQKISDENGEVSFSNVYDFLIFNVTKEGFYPQANRGIKIFSDTLIELYLARKEYEVNFHILKENGSPLWGATVNLGDQSYNTDNQGLVVFQCPEGNYHYSVSMDNYALKEGTLPLSSDTTVELTLTKTHGYIRFRLKDGNAPVNDALVKLDNDSLITDLLGMATFSGLPVASHHQYRISREGYFPVEGEVTFYADTTINISMDVDNTGNNEIFNPENLQLWPNPVNDFLHCHFPEEDNYTVTITDINGRVLYNDRGNKPDIRIKTTDLAPGTYILLYVSDHHNIHKFFVKE